MPQPSLTVDAVRDFFAAVLTGDEHALRRVEQAAGLELQPRGLVFSLPALHDLLDPGGSLAYPEFRRLLYGSTLNEELGAFDAEVTLYRSSGKTDSSLYCLQRLRRT